jgi:hypothetical protein
MSEATPTRGRPRKWASEAERKRAYRLRRAAELAEPEAVRAEAQSARAGAARARTAVEAARRKTEYWRQRAAVAEQRAEGARQRARAAEHAAQRARAERDEAKRLLRNKLHWSRDARPLRNDPDQLLALVADLRRELEGLRRQLALARQALAMAAHEEVWRPSVAVGGGVARAGSTG